MSSQHTDLRGTITDDGDVFLHLPIYYGTGPEVLAFTFASSWAVVPPEKFRDVVRSRYKVSSAKLSQTMQEVASECLDHFFRKGAA